MNPATKTTALLIVVIAGTVLSTASWNWTGSWSYLATVVGAFVAGMAAGRITRIVREAAA